MRSANNQGQGRWRLLFILVLAFGLRVYQLDAQSLWYDEAVTAQVVQQGLAELARWTADDIQPPLYYALVAGWVQLAGDGEWALRFPSAAFGWLAVPLAYVLGRRLFGRPAGLLAALLAALHPLWIYHSQEARMYTLLTELGMLAGYALLRVLPPTATQSCTQAEQPSLARSRRVWWGTLVLSSAALLYTHYFAIFLLLSYGLLFLFVMSITPPANRRRWLLKGSAAATLALLAYLPWLPNALRRFAVDASYWQGTLKLEEALRHIAISFTTGETVLESEATPLAVGLAALATVCTMTLLIRARPRSPAQEEAAGSGGPSVDRSARLCDPRVSVVFTLLYLLLPLVAILGLAYRSPKFNPRYLMLASPGLVLLLAGGLSLPLGATPRRLRSWRGVPLLALAAVLVTFGYATWNWFTDPAFTKDDWRGVTNYVRSHIEEDEGVVLVSGHAWPAWRYYAPQLVPLRLPALEILDVDAVLSIEDAGILRTGLADRRGAWLVQWQEEVVDPTGVLAFLLAQEGQEVAVEPSFWGLGKPRHFRWSGSPAFAADPMSGDDTTLNFGNQVELLSFTQPGCQPAATSPCPLVVFWQALAPVTGDYKLTATLTDDSGHTWGQVQDRRLTAYTYPTFRWQPGVPILSQIEVAPDPGTPPGPYRLRLGVYEAGSGQVLDLLDEAGRPAGQWAWLEPIRLESLAIGRGEAPDAEQSATLAAPALELVAASLDRTQAEPGDRLTLEAWWRSQGQSQQDYQLHWQWIGPNGVIGKGGHQPPGGADFPTTRWPVQAVVRSQVTVEVPPEPVAGLWHLRLGLANKQSPMPFAGQVTELPVTVVPSTRRFTASPPRIPAAINLGGLVELVGISIAEEVVQAPATVAVTVTWRSLVQMETAYTGFVHLLDPSGKLVTQDDQEPLEGLRPTTGWVPGEVLEDRYELELTADLVPGGYQLEIGLYDAGRMGLPRLATPSGATSVLLGEIAVVPGS